MLKVYRERIVGPVPAFPDQMEQRITAYLNPAPTMLSPAPAVVTVAPVGEAALSAAAGASGQRASAAELGWLQQNNAMVSGPITTANSFTASRDR